MRNLTIIGITCIFALCFITGAALAQSPAAPLPDVTMAEDPPPEPKGPISLVKEDRGEVLEAIGAINEDTQTLLDLQEAEAQRNLALEQRDIAIKKYVAEVRARQANALRASISGVMMDLNLKAPPQVAFMQDGERRLFLLRFNLIPAQAGGLVTVEQKKRAFQPGSGVNIRAMLAGLAADAGNRPNNNGLQVLVGPVDRTGYDKALNRLYAPAYLLEADMIEPLWLNEGTDMAALQVKDPEAIIPVTMEQGSWDSEALDAANHALGAGLVDSIPRGRTAGAVPEALTIARDNVRAAKCVDTRLQLLGNRKDFKGVAAPAVKYYNGKQFPKEPDSCLNYTVRAGDTLGKIAARFCGDAAKYKAIMQTNGLSSDAIYPGDQLMVPCGSGLEE